MVEVVNNKKEIESLIAEKINGKKLIFTNYYKLSIAEKGIEHKKEKFKFAFFFL